MSGAARIPRDFFEQDTLTAARALLGQVLVHETAQGVTKGVVVETEAYRGQLDAAAHSYRGRTERTAVQYGPSGCAYVYMIYGMYYCMNITTGAPGVPEVVLLRALEPLSGLELMKSRRGTEDIRNLCRGPGKLCMAMGIGREQYGSDLCAGGSFYLEYGSGPESIEASRRINIDYAGDASEFLWRFSAGGSPFVSAPARKNDRARKSGAEREKGAT